MIGVVKLVPVAIDVPPVKVVYQFIIPEDVVAPKFTVPTPVLDPGVVLVMLGVVLIVATIAVLVAVVQPLLVAST